MNNKLLKMKLIFVFLFLITANVYSQSFIFKQNSNQNKEHEKIKFTNGQSLIKTKIDQDSTFGETVLLLDSNNKTIRKIDESDMLNIVGSYPNSSNALIALIQSNSSGTCCPWSDYQIVYIHNNQIIMHDYLTSMTGDLLINMDLNNNKIKDLMVSNISDGHDKYGDDVKSKRKLILGKGFIRDGFQNKFLNLAQSHPEDYFSNKQFREQLVKKIGFENFKTLRSYMSVASPSVIKDGRYIVFHGMAAHSGGAQNGILVIDAINENYWAVWINQDNKVISNGSTSPLVEEILSLINFNNYNEGYSITFKNNKFNLK